MKQPFYKNTLFKVISFTVIAWIVIYITWAQYPQRLMHDDMVDSNQWNQQSWVQNEWNGIPYKIPDPTELKGNSHYNSLGEKYGTYGDMYGSLNTLFSGLAFSTLIISLILQMLELNATRKELAEQKDALIGQKAEFQKQTSIQNKQMKIASKQQKLTENQSLIIKNQLKESKIQNFNNLFNTLLKERDSRIQRMIIYSNASNSKDLVGNEIFVLYSKSFLLRLKNKKITLEQFLRGLDPNTENEKLRLNAREIIKEHWNFYESNENRNYAIGNYFGVIFRLYELIENHNDVLDKSSETYKEIINSIMTIHEHIVAFWFCLTDSTYDSFIYKHALFRNLPYTEGLFRIAKEFYKVDAFKGNINWEQAFQKQE